MKDPRRGFVVALIAALLLLALSGCDKSHSRCYEALSEQFPANVIRRGATFEGDGYTVIDYTIYFDDAPMPFTCRIKGKEITTEVHKP